MKEHKNKLSLKGNKNGAGNKGRVYSPETLAKMSSVKSGNTNKAGKWDKEIEKLDPRKTPGFRGLWLVSLVNQKKTSCYSKKQIMGSFSYRCCQTTYSRMFLLFFQR